MLDTLHKENVMRRIGVLLILITLLWCASLGQEENDSVFSAGWIIVWNKHLAVATNPDSLSRDTLFNIAPSVEERTNVLKEEDDYFPEEWHVLSIVGPFVTIRDTKSSSNGGEVSLKTVELGSKKQVTISDLFHESDVLKALLSTDQVASRLSKPDPKDLADLIGNIDGGCDMDFNELLTSFCLYYSEEDTATVQFLLSPGCLANPAGGANFQIKLPILPGYRVFFDKALENRSLGLYLE